METNNFVDTEQLIEDIATIRLRIENAELKELKAMNEVQYIFKLQDEFEDFFNSYPTLFKKIIMEEDLSQLAVYISMINRIKDGDINQKDAESQLGNELANQYLYPALNKK